MVISTKNEILPWVDRLVVEEASCLFSLVPGTPILIAYYFHLSNDLDLCFKGKIYNTIPYLPDKAPPPNKLRANGTKIK